MHHSLHIISSVYTNSERFHVQHNDDVGLQAAEGVNHHSGSHAVHQEGLLEDGVRKEVQCDCHAL